MKNKNLKITGVVLSLFLMAAVAFGGATFSRSKTFIAGEVLTATDLNGVETNILNNFTPAGMDDYSTDITAMGVTTDPYPASSESLATSLQGEIERLRYVIKQLSNKAQWYFDPEKPIYNNAYIASGTNTYTLNITGYSTYVEGDVFVIKFATASTVTTPTLNITSLGAKTIKRASDTALEVGDIANNHEAILFYDGTNFILNNPVNAINATTVTDGAITTAKLGNLQVTGEKIAATALTDKFLKARGRINSSENLLNTSNNKILLDSEDYDVGGILDIPNSKFIPTIAGYYDVQYQVSFIGNVSSNTHYAKLYKNGALISQSMIEIGHVVSVTVKGSDLVYMNGSTDYLELYAYHASGGTQIAGTDTPNGTFMSVQGPF